MLTVFKCATVDHISSNASYSGVAEGVWDQGGVISTPSSPFPG